MSTVTTKLPNTSAKAAMQVAPFSTWAFSAALRLSDQDKPIALKLLIELAIVIRMLARLLQNAQCAIGKTKVASRTPHPFARRRESAKRSAAVHVRRQLLRDATISTSEIYRPGCICTIIRQLARRTAPAQGESMFSHIMIGSNDIERSKSFYDAVLGLLGAGEPFRNQSASGHIRYFYRHAGITFGIGEPINGEEATCANGGTIGFKCSSPEQLQQFHDIAVAHGGISIEDPPGVRNSEMGAMHLAYVRDPDGNKLCAMYRAK